MHADICGCGTAHFRASHYLAVRRPTLWAGAPASARRFWPPPPRPAWRPPGSRKLSCCHKLRVPFSGLELSSCHLFHGLGVSNDTCFLLGCKLEGFWLSGSSFKDQSRKPRLTRGSRHHPSKPPAGVRQRQERNHGNLSGQQT